MAPLVISREGSVLHMHNTNSPPIQIIPPDSWYRGQSIERIDSFMGLEDTVERAKRWLSKTHIKFYLSEEVAATARTNNLLLEYFASPVPTRLCLRLDIADWRRTLENHAPGVTAK